MAKMGTARFDEGKISYEQRIINSLYRMFQITHPGEPLESFESVLKQKPHFADKSREPSRLADELNHIVECLDFSKAHDAFIPLNVNAVFNALEKIIQKINPAEFNEEMFNGFSAVFNRLIVSASNTFSNNAAEISEVVLKYGDLVSLIHNVVITKINVVSGALLTRLEKNETESTMTDTKIARLETASKNQTNKINQIISTIKSLPESKAQGLRK
jgi:hypothetical protein